MSLHGGDTDFIVRYQTVSLSIIFPSGPLNVLLQLSVCIVCVLPSCALFVFSAAPACTCHVSRVTCPEHNSVTLSQHSAHAKHLGSGFYTRRSLGLGYNGKLPVWWQPWHMAKLYLILIIFSVCLIQQASVLTRVKASPRKSTQYNKAAKRPRTAP